ncbi:unnamed protein product [Adineta ricciae]|uniref:Uncharacterized protein n=1 Tax=Adineta ricciae TaxID=249248 RepID=A0A815RHC5_ADIRI|nr:unnamed protein product [Adineta ricciae]CAF1475118.1 unnamed protein product [Adineta ricciae]
MLKSIVCFCFLVLVTVNAVRFELNDNARRFLASVKLSNLPESVRLSLVKHEGRGPSDSSHWCCINEQPITTETQTKIEYGTRTVATKTKVGYIDCGFMGMMKCSNYVTTYRAETYSFVQTFQVPNMAACSTHEMKCCSGYLLVTGNCHSIQDLSANQELFQFLFGLGLLGSTPGK